MEKLFRGSNFVQNFKKNGVKDSEYLKEERSKDTRTGKIENIYKWGDLAAVEYNPETMLQEKLEIIEQPKYAVFRTKLMLVENFSKNLSGIEGLF